jgi:hypothetical protein
MRYTIKHTIETDADSFWNKLYFDPEFNQSLYREFFGYLTYDVLEHTIGPGGALTRRVAAAPNTELPAAAKAVLRTSTLAFNEVGHFDPVARKYSAQVAVDGTNKLKVSYEVTAEPAGDRACERIAVIHDEVKVPGLGAVIEAALQKGTRDSYNRAADFTNRWIRDKGL